MEPEIKMLTDLKEAAKEFYDYKCRYVAEKLGVPLNHPDIELLIRTPLGKSPASLELMEQLPHIVKSDAHIVIQGETGTGKGGMAFLIHAASGRNGRFERLNLAGYPHNLAWSHVIGHTADAFTGPKVGKLGSYCFAHQGTLFIDEFDQIEPLVQSMFLDITQRTAKRLRRVGSTLELHDEIKTGFLKKDLALKRTKNKSSWLLDLIDDIKTDGEPKVRMLFGVLTNIKEKVERGEFREDLYHRINILNIHLPNVEERKLDFKGSVGSALNDLSQHVKIKGFCPEFYKQLYDHKWSGNSRQLRNIIQAAIAYANDGIIRYSKWLEPAMQDIHITTKEMPNKETNSLPSVRSLPKSRTRSMIAAVLNEVHPPGNYHSTSKVLEEQRLLKVSGTAIKNMICNGEIQIVDGKYISSINDVPANVTNDT